MKKTMATCAGIVGLILFLYSGTSHGATGKPTFGFRVNIPDWSLEALNCLADWGVIENPIPSSDWHSMMPLSRAEVVVVICRVRNAVIRTTGRSPTIPPRIHCYGDIPTDHWAASAVDQLTELGILKGFPSFVDVAPDHWIRKDLDELTRTGVILAEEKFRQKAPPAPPYRP